MDFDHDLMMERLTVLCSERLSLSIACTLYFDPCYTNSFYSLNSLPNNKILDWFLLKAFADDRVKLAKIMIFVFNRIENIVGKGQIAGYQHFLLFPQCFQKAFFLGSLKVVIVW